MKTQKFQATLYFCIKYLNFASQAYWGFPGGSKVKASSSSAGNPVPPLGWEDPLEKEMATHSSILA